MNPEAVAILARGGSASEAATAAGVAERTVRRWLADRPEFDDAIREARSKMIERAVGVLSAATVGAAARLAGIVLHGEDKLALPAARAILDMASRYRADQDIEKRIAELELAAGIRSTT